MKSSHRICIKSLFPSIISNIVVFLYSRDLSGYFKDESNNYHGLFHTMGGVCLVSASLWIFECAIRKRREGNKFRYNSNATDLNQGTLSARSPEVD